VDGADAARLVADHGDESLMASWLTATRMAAGAAFRFARANGAGAALRLGLLGAWTLGPRGLVRRAAADNRQREDDARYREWLRAHTPDAGALAAIRADVAAFRVRPTISLVTPVFNTPPEWLRRCVESVQEQIYPHWELCLCDDGSTNPETIAMLEALGADSRVRVVRSALNGGIVRASNAALALATGEYIGLFDHDDELAPDALAEIVRCLNADPDIDVVYTDEDKIDQTGARSQPHFKPDWSPELMRSCMYVSHFTVMRRSLMEAAGAFRAGTDGAQDYDLLLRAMERTSKIAHVPKVLYHWRMLAGSTASSQLGKPWAVAAGQKALEAFLERQAVPARVTSGEANGHYIVKYASRPEPPLVSIIAPPHAVAGVQAALARTRYRRFELVDVAAGLHENRRLGRASGEFLLFMEGVDRRISDGWIEALLGLAEQDGIGVVSGIVLFADRTIENAGFAFGSAGAPLPIYRGEPAWTRGHLSNILDVRNCAAVGGVCLMTRRTTFDAVGGFDESAGSLYAIDYCLRVRREGLRVAVTPDVTVRRAATKVNDPTAEEVAGLKARWPTLTSRDPYYNPNFDQRAATFRLPQQCGDARGVF
jgi:GT2 family glycosyltransferase